MKISRLVKLALATGCCLALAPIVNANPRHGSSSHGMGGRNAAKAQHGRTNHGNSAFGHRQGSAILGRLVRRTTPTVSGRRRVIARSPAPRTRKNRTAAVSARLRPQRRATLPSVMSRATRRRGRPAPRTTPTARHSPKPPRRSTMATAIVLPPHRLPVRNP